MQVKEAMHQNAEWVDPDTTVSELAETMRNLDIGALVVGKKDKFIGIVTDRDIVCRGVAEFESMELLTARDVMTEGITYCRETEPLIDAVKIMKERRIRRLPVLGDDERLVGMLTIGDVSAVASKQLVSEVVRVVASHHL